MKKSLVTILICVLLLIVGCSGNRYYQRVGDRKHNRLLNNKQLNKTMYERAVKIIEENYVNENGEGIKLDKNGKRDVKRLIAQLSPHCQYVKLGKRKKAKGVGIGIMYNKKKDYLRVIATLPGTSAIKAGVLPNDKITKVNGKHVSKMSRKRLKEEFGGEEGKEIKLTVVEKDGKEVDLITRLNKIEKQDPIKVVKLNAKKIGYIRIVEYTHDIDKQLSRIIREYKENGINALMIDLRNIPWDLFDDVVRVCGKFVSKGTIVYSIKGQGLTIKRLFKTSSNMELDVPLAVLVNKGTLTESMLLAEAIRKNTDAVMIGTTGKLKGYKMKKYRLTRDDAINIVVGYLYDTNDTKVQDQTYEPDIIVEMDSTDERGLYYKNETIFDMNDISKNLYDPVIKSAYEYLIEKIGVKDVK